ncbi:Hypothetical predicted protein, partial [Paramuricea clavata]
KAIIEKQAKSLQYLSDEYDDQWRRRSVVNKEIKRLDTKLTNIILKFDKISEQIDAIEQYSYNYNVKIIGIPQTQDRNETAANTADIYELDFHFNIIGVTETKITNLTQLNFETKIPGYEFEYVPTPLASGGVGMYIDNTLEYTVLEKCKSLFSQ